MKKAIGYRIRKLRESKDYSQENMAGELNITAGAYAKIERGETDPSATRLIRIAEILEVDVAVFFQNELQVPGIGAVSGRLNYASKYELDTLSNEMREMSLELEKLKKEMAVIKKTIARQKP